MTNSNEEEAHSPLREWKYEGGERHGGPNVLPRWSVYSETFPDTTGMTGTGIVNYTRSTFAYINAEEDVIERIVTAANSHSALVSERDVLVKALEPFAEFYAPGVYVDLTDASCHYGVSTAEECTRCRNVIAARAALALVGRNKKLQTVNQPEAKGAAV